MKKLLLSLLLLAPLAHAQDAKPASAKETDMGQCQAFIILVGLAAKSGNNNERLVFAQERLRSAIAQVQAQHLRSDVVDEVGYDYLQKFNNVRKGGDDDALHTTLLTAGKSCVKLGILDQEEL